MKKHRFAALSRKPLLVALCFLIWALISHSAHSDTAKCDAPDVIDATFNLQCIDQHGETSLNGQWQLQLQLTNGFQYDGLVEVPGVWSALDNNVQQETRGTGQYTLTFTGSAAANHLALSIPRMWAAKHIYLRYPSGRIHTLLQHGDLTKPESEAPIPVGRQLLQLPDLESGTQLIWEMGAYDTIYSGLWQAPKLGPALPMSRHDTLRKSLTSSIAITLLLFAALNLALWRARFRSRAMMVLPIAATCLALRQLNDANLMTEFLPGFTIHQDAALSWLSYLIGVGVGFFYIQRRFDRVIPLWLGVPPIVLSAIGALLVIFAGNVTVQEFGQFHRPFIVVCAFLIFGLLIKRNPFKSLDHRLTLLGITLIVVALAIDIAHYHFYATGFLVPVNSIAWIFFIGSQIYLLSWRYFATMQRNIKLNNELSELNQHLEQRIHKRTEELNEKNQQLEQLYKTDALTELANRRALTEFAEREFARLKRNPGHLSVALIDIDFFKQVNDQYGHQAGDETLKAIANVLRHAVREVDMVARWGGEEFCVMFPGIDQFRACKIMERIRKQVQDLKTTTEEGRCIQVTFSSGIADTKEPMPLQKLMVNADQALYQAKTQGRNRTLCWNPNTTVLS